MRIAAYQAPLLAAGSMDALDLVRERIAWCEQEGVSILCCPEAILGGLADYSDNPAALAIPTDQLASVLAPLASPAVASIVGFTELADDGALYNAAAILHRGEIAGVYRKLHPAIRRSVYSAGSGTPVFRVDGLTFGVILCNDSNYPDPARRMAEQGATVLFIPSNNGLPNQRVAESARSADIRIAKTHRLWVVRADVAGSNGVLTSHGSSEIVDPHGRVVFEATPQCAELIVVEIENAFGPRMNADERRSGDGFHPR